MSLFLQDLKSGLRILLKNPGTAVLGLVVLTLGLGLNAAMFSIVNGVVLKGLPIDGADRLKHIDAARPEKGQHRQRVTLPEFLDWREQQSTFESLHAFRLRGFFLSGQGEAVRVNGAQITPGAFHMLGIQPRLGRELQEQDSQPGAPRVAVIGHGFWLKRLAGDPNAIGREIRIDGRPTTVVGVMPESFQFPANEEVWLPLPMEPPANRAEAGNNLHVFGFVKQGVGSQAAFADLSVICSRMAELHPETDAGLTVVIDSYSRFFIGEQQATLAWACFGAVGFLLLIACANVANLLLARASDRTSEMAMRLALGAGPSRIAAQVLAETIVLAALAVPAGLALATALVELFNHAVAGQGWPFWLDVKVEGTTFVYLLVITGLTTLLSGAAPAFESVRIDLSTVLADRTIGSRARSRLSAGLVIAEVALSCALLIGAGLLVRSIVQMSQQDTAFDPSSVVTGRVLLHEANYPDAEARSRFWSEATTRLQGLPTVADAGFSDYLPTVNRATLYYYAADHATYAAKEDQPFVGRAIVSNGWFETLGIEPLRGRLFSDTERNDSEPVAVVSDTFARQQWGDANVLGKWVRLGAQESTAEPWRQVIGVVPDLLRQSFQKENAHIFIPLAQAELDYAAVVARGRGAGADQEAELVRGLRQTLHGLAPDVPVYETTPFSELIAEETFLHRLVATLFSIMAAVGLLMAGTGLYGILAFFVSKRTAEAGLRAALGANKVKLALWIASHGLRHVVVGLGIGLALAFLLAQALASSLEGIRFGDPLVFGGVVLALLVVALISTLVPAWRATRVNPSVALRR